MGWAYFNFKAKGYLNIEDGREGRKYVVSANKHGDDCHDVLSFFFFHKHILG